MFLLFICGTYSQHSSPAPPQPRHIWGAGEEGNVTHGPQKQHPWGTRASPSTAVGSQPQLGARTGGPRGSMLAIQGVMGTRWPWGQMNPCPSSHPVAESHSQRVGCQVRLGSISFFSGCWQSHQVDSVAQVSPRAQSHRHTPARPPVLPVSPGRALPGSPAGGWQVQGD